MQYTQAGHSSGWLSGVVAAPLPFSTTSEEELFSAAAPPVLSSAFTPLPPPETAAAEAAAAAHGVPLLLFLGLAKEAEEAEDAELSVLQLESWHGVPGRLGLLTRSRPEVCALSRALTPCSFLQPKSGRRMLSMKKLVVLWACCAACSGRMGGEGRLGAGDPLTLSPSLLLALSRCSSISAPDARAL